MNLTDHTDLTQGQGLPAALTQWPALRRVAATWTAAARIGAMLGIVLTAGCANLEHAPNTDAAPQAAPAAPVASTAPVDPRAAAPAPPTQPATAERARTADKASQQPSAGPSASPAQGAAQGVAKPAPAPAPSKASAKPIATPSTAAATATATAKRDSSAAVLAKPQGAPPLDLKSLETRLKETHAIGVFTKLTLKNQIDALLDQFRAFYQGKVKPSMADLRRSYDMLVLKVVALLQEADPPLANAVAASREAIWGILSNPVKFAAV